MNPHRVGCPVWGDWGDETVTGRCTCPRDWLIRKSRDGDRYPWRVHRRTSDDTYELFIRTSDFHQARTLVVSMVTLTRTPQWTG